MKKTAFFFLLLLGVSSLQPLRAAIRRVGFTQAMTLVAGIDYPTFQAAHDAAAAGDTIQLYPSAVSNGAGYSGTITKMLVILGPGYLYNGFHLPYGVGLFNTNLQLLPGSTYNNNFTLGKGSNGTIFQGLFYTTIGTASFTDSLNNIQVTRCRDITVNFSNSGVCNNWRLSKNIRVSVNQGGYEASFTGNRSITNLRIENCLGASIYYAANGPQSPQGVNTGQVVNCVFYNTGYSSGLENAYSGVMTLNNSYFLFQNNIDGMNYFQSYMSGLANCIFINNMTTIGPANTPVFTNPGCTGNIFGVNFAGNAIFTSVPNNVSGSTYISTADAAFRLSASSPAKGAGLLPGTNTATDLGVFGGLDPYILSGIPPVPSFYRFNAATTTPASSPYTLTFSVRGNN